MTRSALARPPGGWAASRREHMASGNVTGAGVTRKSRRYHANWRRYDRYVTSQMRTFTQLLGVEMVRNTVYDVATREFLHSRPRYGYEQHMGTRWSQLMTATLLNYVRYCRFRTGKWPTMAVLRVRVDMRATMMARCGLL